MAGASRYGPGNKSARALDPARRGRYRPAPMPTVPARSSSPGRYTKKTWLKIDGHPVASVERYSGGDPYAEVINEPGGMLPYAKKHLGALHFADLEAQVSMDANPLLHHWIRDAWFGKASRDRVVLETIESSGTTTRGLQLAHPRLRNVTLPGLDVTSRERRYLALSIVFRGVQRIAGKTPAVQEREEREFRAQHFQIDLAGLDCSGVLQVDPISVQLELPAEGVRKASTLVFPDLHLHLDAEKADSFRAWFDDFVIAGNNDDDQERDGSITYNEPFGGALATLRLFHAGIYRITDEPAIPPGPPRVRVDLYVERMEFARMDTESGSTEQGMAPIEVE